ncbi:MULTISPECIES: hypothetical protein [Sphingobacterium]|uniref:hypothetical protein n=1 Tax=Sphingobacterium TaxID=28453 RepID=UPI0028ABA870|nr:hypothetical protein [Sphingobacterium multivorum]
MVNRINKWWKEVMDWKERWEKLLPSNYINSRTFQKAELKKLEKVISYSKAKLNEEERLSQKLLYHQKYKELERSLYPNPLVRLIRNAGKLTGAAITWTFNKIRYQPSSGTKNQTNNGTVKPGRSDMEVREFLKNSMNEVKIQNRKLQKSKVTTSDVRRKVPANSRKKSAVIVPFKPAKGIRKGI